MQNSDKIQYSKSLKALRNFPRALSETTKSWKNFAKFRWFQITRSKNLELNEKKIYAALQGWLPLSGKWRDTNKVISN